MSVWVWVVSGRPVVCVGGPHLHPLPHAALSPRSSWNFFAATDAITSNITAGRTYVNVHTVLYGAGEIRGAVVAAVGASPTPRPSGATAPAVGAATAAALLLATIVAVMRRDE